MALNLINFRLLDGVFIAFAMIALLQEPPRTRKEFSEKFGLSRNPLNICIILFLMSGIIGLVNSTTPIAHKVDVALQVRWIFGFYCCYAFGQYTRSQNLNLELRSIVFPTTLAYLLYRHYDSAAHLLFNSNQRFQGFFENTNHLALAMVMPLGFYVGFLTFAKRSSYTKSILIFSVQLLSLALIAVALLATYSRTSWIGAAAILCTALILSRSRILALVCSILFVFMGLIITLNDNGFLERILGTRDLSPTGTEAGRLSAWKASWQIFLDHPFFGVGFEHPQFHYSSYYSKMGISQEYIVGHAHNQFLQILSETGLIGTLSYLSIIALAAGYFFKRLKNQELQDKRIALCGLLIIVGLFFTSFTDAPFRLHEVRNYILLFAGFSYGYLERKRNHL